MTGAGPETILIGFAILLVLLSVGMHIGTALFATAAFGSWWYFGGVMFNPFGTMMWSTLNNFLLVAIPLYVLMGEILVRAGITARMYTAIDDWMRHLPGGLLHTNLAASTVFASISGSSVATAATIGTVAFPAFRDKAYAEKWVLGTVVSGATIGILIPPSINLIIFGAMTNTSIGQLFLAGVVPGLLLASLFMGTVIIASVLDPTVSESAPPDALAARLRRLRDLLPPLLIFIGVMGSIYTGWATPTEAAGLGVVAATILVALHGDFTIRLLLDSALSTVKVSAMTLLILIAAFYLNFIVGVIGIPALLTNAMAGLTIPAWQMIMLLVVIYVALGCFMDSLAMMIATTPIVFPVVVALGYDPLWFGVFLVIMCEIALITPPVGMNIFVVQAVRGRGSVTDVIKGVIPFIACFFALAIAITAFPNIVTWLPNSLE
ncbi:TRAP transporter large permease subunit [Rhodobacteraceae bacterium 2CG4]|uniref:TRAP transporter large permease protein n=1 Tax=Halovulum marinum TaxID=2662447 RepID=A0A6L5Z2Q0_9RHOB|nr:TRAP transporter large permease [Halovulum marinum]MSU90843.1 TRAP transporter large permease subunit [Halovulum marinum]